jgi:hypothetical protein
LCLPSNLWATLYVALHTSCWRPDRQILEITYKTHYSELTFTLTTTAQVHSVACEAIHISNTNTLHPHLLPFKHKNLQFYLLVYQGVKIDLSH